MFYNIKIDVTDKRLKIVFSNFTLKNHGISSMILGSELLYLVYFTS